MRRIFQKKRIATTKETDGTFKEQEVIYNGTWRRTGEGKRMLSRWDIADHQRIFIFILRETEGLKKGKYISTFGF